MPSIASTLVLLPLALGVLSSPVVPRDDSPAPVTVTVTFDAEATSTGSSDDSVYNWNEGWKPDFPIHSSCNVTLRNQLEAGLKETIELAAHARDHLLRFGNESEIARRYFGNASLAGPVGWYSKVATGNKDGIVFRCDDPDKNCATQEGWAGHWRGENATQETVICPLSFETRYPLSAVCNVGYTVAYSPLNTYWATDLLHRAFHLPLISEDLLEHYAEDFADALRLAEEEPEKAVMDSDSLQYFAIDAWAYDISAPGVGCTGEPDEESDGHSH